MADDLGYATVPERPYSSLVRHAIVRLDELPELPPELVCGVIRRGGKLLVSCASKAGKSYLLIELSVAVATGGRWCGFRCARGRVLYANLEVQEPQFMHRVFRVAEAMRADPDEVRGGVDVLNLRGRVSRVDDLVANMAASFPRGTYDLVVIDPAYKVQSGSENDADAITAFCGALDRLAEALGCTIAYSHHHSKGAQGGKDAADRASGSGVFARDADALVDMIELQPDEAAMEAERILGHRDGAVPFRLEFVLRDFARPKPRDIWFRYPIHEEDASGALEGCRPKKAGIDAWRADSRDRALSEVERACDELMGDRDEMPRKELVRATGKDVRTVNRYLKQSSIFELLTGESTATIRRRD
jgi:hypothetical protein